MAQIRQYRVTLYPATRSGNSITTRFELFGKSYPQMTFDAAGVPDMVRQVTAFATEHGEGCRASVQCLAARKPPGFDKATGALYFNLDESLSVA